MEKWNVLVAREAYSVVLTCKLVEIVRSASTVTVDSSPGAAGLMSYSIDLGVPRFSHVAKWFRGVIDWSIRFT